MPTVPPADSSPPEGSPSEVSTLLNSRRKSKARTAIPRDLITPPKADDKDEAAMEIPYTAGMTVARPVVSIGFQMATGEMIFPWTSLISIQRVGTQMLIKIGGWIFQLEYDPGKAKGWNFIDLMEALMDQSVRWVRNSPELGLTLTGEELDEEKPAQTHTGDEPEHEPEEIGAEERGQ